MIFSVHFFFHSILSLGGLEGPWEFPSDVTFVGRITSWTSAILVVSQNILDLEVKMQYCSGWSWTLPLRPAVFHVFFLAQSSRWDNQWQSGKRFKTSGHITKVPRDAHHIRIRFVVGAPCARWSRIFFVSVSDTWRLVLAPSVEGWSVTAWDADDSRQTNPNRRSFPMGFLLLKFPSGWWALLVNIWPTMASKWGVTPIYPITSL